MLTWAQITIGILYSGIAHERQPNSRLRKKKKTKKHRNGGILRLRLAYCRRSNNVFLIDILGSRLPTHTWRGRHMHEDSRWRRQPGKNIRNSVTNYRFLGFFDGLIALNPLPLNFFENRPLLRRFGM